MIGQLSSDQKQLFDAFCLDKAMPADHPVREIANSIDEAACDAALEIAETRAFEKMKRCCGKVEMASAHLKRIHRLNRLRPRRATGDQNELTLASIP